MADVEAVVPTGSAGRRAGLVTLDQVLSGASNLFVVLLGAHVLTPLDFGVFSVILLTYGFALAPTRAVISVPVLVHPEDADERPWRVLGSASVLGSWVGAIFMVVGALLYLSGSDMGPAALLSGLLLPLLQLHDVGRYLAIARHNPGRALILDLTWLVLMVGAFVVAQAFELLSLVSLVLIWGGSGAAAALWLFVHYRLPSREDISLTWLRERWDFSWRSLVANTSTMGGALFGAVAISFVSSPVAVAAVRAALLLGRPSAMVQMSVASSVAADVARDTTDARGLRKHQLRAMSISGAAALVNLGVLMALPDWAGKALLGNVWPLIEPLMLAVGLTVVGTAAQSGVRAVLLGRRQIKITMVADLAGAAITIGSMAVGAYVGDAPGAVWGLVVGQALTAAFWWGAFLRYLATTQNS
jgi:O-antigen/teichoic acid export membrane protein